MRDSYDPAKTAEKFVSKYFNELFDLYISLNIAMDSQLHMLS